MSFNPTEIIFAATDACNLHCAHCFVNRTPNKLSIEKAVLFLKNCILDAANKTDLPVIEKIGFSGGEPFLYLDFIIALTRTAVDLNLMFDQIMTNGDWWTDEVDLRKKLQSVYDAGYDGKIGLSYDSFHGQKKERINTFISTVQEIFGKDSLNIQTVLQKNEVPEALQIEKDNIKQYFLPQTFPSEDERAWKAKKWFKDDYCEGPGQILYIHPDGNIAPCCGFANENQQLFIGTIEDPLEKIMQTASDNKIVRICYETGLGKYRKQMKKELRKAHKKLPGKCNDLCSFCDFICKNQES